MSLRENIYYVYRHIRLDKDEPFYIGIGNSNYKYNRANAKSHTQRNKHWINIANKSDIEIEIILEGLTLEEANNKEIEFIKLYGRHLDGGTLCNIKEGGEAGGVGNNITESHKKAISKKAIQRFENEDYIEKYRFARSNFKHSEETLQKFKEARKHKKNPPKGVRFDKPAEQVVQLTKEGIFIMVHKSITSTKKLGYLPTSIVKVCKGKSKYHLGYQWKYLFNY